MTREEWLDTLVSSLRPSFTAAGAELPTEIAISVGFPKSHGRGASNIIGQCWRPAASELKRPEIFVHPVLADPIDVGAVVVHELVHAAGHYGHRADFAGLARTMGLDKPWTATTPCAWLGSRLLELTTAIGEFPHGRLNSGTGAKEVGPGSRLVKVECPSCGYTVRTTRKWLEIGMPTCPCGTDMEER